MRDLGISRCVLVYRQLHNTFRSVVLTVHCVFQPKLLWSLRSESSLQPIRLLCTVHNASAPVNIIVMSPRTLGGTEANANADRGC